MAILIDLDLLIRLEKDSYKFCKLDPLITIGKNSKYLRKSKLFLFLNFSTRYDFEICIGDKQGLKHYSKREVKHLL